MAHSTRYLIVTAALYIRLEVESIEIEHVRDRIDM
jgi:hypothetical protein